jgi:hypothetical protein
VKEPQVKHQKQDDDESKDAKKNGLPFTLISEEGEKEYVQG